MYEERRQYPILLVLYIDKLRERGTLPPTTCAAQFLWDVQLGGTRLPTWAF
jgi:uncharacterized protein YfaQ (DUF2300 family)